MGNLGWSRATQFFLVRLAGVGHNSLKERGLKRVWERGQRLEGQKRARLGATTG